ncbi:MAG: 1-acyl-sn-glycerol-3-phosphate acyltransferase [Bacteroidales bacterium]|nr:1-acyl-sn-glycerol-3-phosphate acyltransferase [Candidatus Cryptobacteroides choladohippi]MCQ2178503.1 1-acyl-sn-glycerol-3-phosphate acyltransferase [Bacteroidales bacterium]
MRAKICRFILCKVLGWTLVGEKPAEEKLIFLAAPHTSIWDFVMGYLFYGAMGGHLTTMIKKEAFVFPLNFILRAMGAFPIDRSHPQKMLMSVMHEMRKPGTFHLVICPEGTRKAVAKWKTGYHTIASNCNIPVYLTGFDYANKRIGIFSRYELAGTAREDTDRIQEIYRSYNLTGLHKDMYIA